MNHFTTATLVVASLGSLHCADTAAPVTATVALRADLPGAASACFRMEFRDADGDTRSAPNAIKMLCGTVDERGVFSAQDEVACSAGDQGKRVFVNFGTAPTDRPGVWADPCGAAGCAVDLTCGGATELDFVMANDNTYADWTPTNVALRDGSFGATFATCSYDGPLVIDGRDRVAVLGFVGATLDGGTHLSLAEPEITCDGGTTCRLAFGDGSTAVDSTCSDGSVVQVKTWIGTEVRFPGTPESRYTNLLLDLADLIDSGNTNCVVRHAATVSDGPLTVGPHATYPVASFHGTLIDEDGELPCFSVNFDDYGDEDAALLSIGYLRGSALSSAAGAWTDEVPTLCYESNAEGLTSRCR